MRALFIALAFCPFGETNGKSDSFSFRGKPYDAVRIDLIRENWQVSRKADNDRCSTFPDWCEQRPEMHHCQIVGPIARCLYLWSKNHHTLSIVTTVDGDVVESVIDSPPR